MDAKTLAKRLDGREYGDEITKQEEHEAKESRLVVVFGYSDDNVEFRGGIRDEFGAYDGVTLYILQDGRVLNDEHDCECDYCGYDALKERGKAIKCIWGGDVSWTFETEISHETFNVMEDGELFCIGIVFSLDSIS